MKDGVSLAEAARRFFRNPSPSAVSRWVNKGVRAPGGTRVFLRAEREGGRLYITEADAAEFLNALNIRPCDELPEPPVTSRPKGRTARQREIAVRRAERRLQRAG